MGKRNIIISGALGQDGIILSNLLSKNNYNIIGVVKKIPLKKENKRVIGDITFIVPDRRLIYKNNKSIELTEKESDIILSLLSSSDRGITREEVMSKVWVLNSNIETHTFETHLYRLRKKIKENLFVKNLIINKDGRYYLNNEIIGQEN